MFVLHKINVGTGDCGNSRSKEPWISNPRADNFIIQGLAADVSDSGTLYGSACLCPRRQSWGRAYKLSFIVECHDPGTRHEEQTEFLNDILDMIIVAGSPLMRNLRRR
jgi:hypothetical protein